MKEADKEKVKKLRALAELIKKGEAGVNREGQIVDLKENPKAVKIPPHV